MEEKMISVIDTEDKTDLVKLGIVEAIKKVKDPFQNLTVKDIMKDLNICKTIAYRLFKRDDFPSINIGKTKTVTYVAYLIWKSTRKEEDADE